MKLSRRIIDAIRATIDVREFSRMTIHYGDPHANDRVCNEVHDTTIAPGDWAQNELAIWNAREIVFGFFFTSRVTHAAIWDRRGDMIFSFELKLGPQGSYVFAGGSLHFAPGAIRITWPPDW